MDDGSWLDLPWPIAGVDRSLSYQKQPPYSTPDALNVRTESTTEFRERGGSRPGLGLAIRTELPGEIRLLTKVSVIKAQWPKNYSPWGGTQLRDSQIPIGWAPPPTYVPSTSSQGTGSGLAGSSWGLGIPVIDYRDTGAPYEVTVHVRPADGATAYDGEVRIAVGLATTTADPEDDSIRIRLILEDDEYSVTIEEIIGSVVANTSTSSIGTDNPNAPGIFAVRVVPGTNTVTAFWRNAQLLSDTVGTLSNHYVAVNTVSADSSIIATKLSTEFTRDTTVSTVFPDLRRDILVAVSNGEIWMEDTADSMRLISTAIDVNDDVDLVATDREQKLFIADYGVAVTGSGGQIASPYNTLTDASHNFAALGMNENYVFEFINSDYSQNEKQTVELGTTTGGTFNLQFRGQLTANIAWNAASGAVQTALQNLSTVDTVTVTGSAGGPWTIEFTGTHAGTNVETLGSNIESLTHGTGTPTITITVVQEGAGGDAFLGQYAITGSTATTITFSPPLAVADGYSGTIGMVEYQLVRAAKVFDPREETLVVHAASTGFTPAGCRLVALYRDRIVYAGSDLLPHVWYMSRQGDPYDWDYSQEDSAAAIAAQSSVAGQLADPITALIPHSDECLFFGCYNSLWILRGDPGYGGTLDQLSRKIGIVSARAWCRTPDDMCVFMSADGLYVTPAGCAGFPTSLSRERLPDELLCLNAARESVHLEYDTVHRGIHIFVTKRDSSESPHWWFDWEAKSFWRVSLQTEHEPFAVHERIAWDDCPIVLVGGRDGFIRYFDRQFLTDDGDNTINSYCDFGPFHLDPDNFKEGVLTEITGVTGVGSGDVSYAIRAGSSAQEADEATAQYSSTWTREGLNFTSHPRVRGVSSLVRVSGTRRWFLERITTLVRGAGKRRAR